MSKSTFRIGIGHDTHRLVDGGPLLIGGVEIPFDRQLDGHSDADVLLHAITDAILGAAAMGDIGELFPDNDERNRGRSSVEMLKLAMNQVAADAWSVVNLDCILFAERPKLSPFKPRIEQTIAAALEIKPGQVNVKAKTGERLGDVGAMSCMMAQCVALLERKN